VGGTAQKPKQAAQVIYTDELERGPQPSHRVIPQAPEFDAEFKDGKELAPRAVQFSVLRVTGTPEKIRKTSDIRRLGQRRGRQSKAISDCDNCDY
jgi:hypothetical protein